LPIFPVKDQLDYEEFKVWAENKEKIDEDKLYLTSNEGRNLCCFDMKERITKWEVQGSHRIKKSVIVNGVYKNKVYNTMIVLVDHAIGLINLDLGRTINYLRMDNVQDIKLSGQHVILHTSSDKTHILAG